MNIPTIVVTNRVGEGWVKNPTVELCFAPFLVGSSSFFMSLHASGSTCNSYNEVKSKHGVFGTKLLNNDVEEWENNPELWGLRRSSRVRRMVRYQVSDEDSVDAPKRHAEFNLKVNNRKGTKLVATDEDSDYYEDFYDDEDEISDYHSSEDCTKSSKSLRYSRSAKRKKSNKFSFGKKNNYWEDGERGVCRENQSRYYTRNIKVKSYAESEVESLSEYTEKEQDSATSDANETQSNQLLIEKICEHKILKELLESNELNSEDYKGVDLETVYYKIKWLGQSHIHNTWESEEDLGHKLVKLGKLLNYKKLVAERDYCIRNVWSKEDCEFNAIQREMTQQVLKSHLKVERIINYKESISEETGEILPFYFCKWLGLPYADCTWESVEDLKNFQHLIDEYLDRTNSRRLPNFMCPVLRRRPFAREITKQPSFIGSAKLLLRDYQLLGLNFLHTAWCHSSNVILADEMGLGKTIQCVSFLGYLQYQYNLNGPFLVIVPLSTIVGWQREFKAWVPQLNCVTYVGDRQSREIIREHEFYTENGKLKFNALLTTYELVVKDVNLLCRIQWAAMIVDEAHRLKNHLSQLHTFLSDFHTNFIILVTGTPLQNSLMELWALLRFIMPKKFGSWEDFQGKYGSELNKTSQISELHNDLRPYLLRRVKKDVEKSLPNKVERILRVELSSLQRELYRLILCRNYAALSSKGQKKSFSNIIVELKKCCNHPFLVQEHETTNEADRLKEIVKNSGKLVLLDKLLLRLKETGHRVLIFSQMVRMLDILADYLTLRGFTFQRLDGCIRNEQRERALDHFNRPNSDDFCFLLSTKAGGLGINLATADTVIIFDSDWNPQNDLQAEARAHRIGQKNVVNIYRLLSKESVEEEIFERAKKKLILDHVVIQRMDASGRTILSNKRKDKIPFDKDEMNSILKFGAEKLFSEEEDKKATKNLEELDIDEILQRAETTQDCIEKTAGEHFLSQFNVADFSTRELEKNWDEIIPESVIQKTQADHYDSEFMAVYCLGPRKVKSVERLAGRSDDAAEGRILKRKTLEKKSQTLVNSGSDFTESEIKRFIRASRKFGNVSVRLDDISEEAGLLHKHPLSLQQLSEGLRTGTLKAIKKFNQYDEVGKNKNFSDDKSFSKKQKNFASFYMGSALVNASEQRQREEDMDILASCISSTHSINFRLPASLKATERWDCDWKNKDDSFLLLGTYIYGLGNWEAIKKDSLFHLNKILPGDGGMPQATHLFNRCVMLFKYLRQKKQANSLLQARKKIPKLRKTSPCKDVDTCALEQAAPTNELSKDSLHYCKSRLRSHKATLRSLSKLKQNVIKYNLTREKANEKFKQYILELGDHIESVLAKESPLESDLHRRVLWDFIATKFISFSSVSEEKLIKVYTKAKLKRTNEEEKLKLN